MPKPVAEVAEGHEDASGNGVYCFIRDLIVEGRDARFVNKKGRYVINWSRALKCYHGYKSKKNPQYKSKNINRRKASNGLRAALLNFYKKEGAKEYKDCKKVNEKDEVVERQFQMPPRVFESLFGSDVQLSDDSSEHETSSIASEADEKPLATPNSSDTGFDEAMDISDDLFNANAEPSSECALGGLPTGDPLCSNVKTEEDQVAPSDITTPCQMFDISEEELDLALEEICSSSETNDIDLLGVVHDICPSSGSVKGGLQFHISLTEALSEDDKSGSAHFDGIGDVFLERLNCYTLAGIIPASQQPGPVPVTVKTQDGHLLGMTYFMYVDEIQEVLKQVVKDPALQSLYLTMWSQEHGFFGSDGNLAQNLGPFTLQDQGSSVQGTCAQALKGLQLLVYTAAQTNAQQFIQMIFNTSAGKLIFDAYKDRPQLPEDVARVNGHDDLAQYLQDVNTRLSKESGSDDKPNVIDWLELIEAVNKIQKQSSVIEDETDLGSGESKDDDNQSDYFADAETSSCGSFDLEIGWSDSEDREGTRKWLKGDDVTTSSQQGACVNETQEVGSFGEGIFQGVSGGGTQKRENINDRKQETRTGPSQAKRHNQRSQWRPFRGALLKSFLLLTIAVTTVLCLVVGIKIAGAPNFRGETPLHVTSNEGYHLVMAREHVFLIKLMTCSLMCVLLVILIVMGIRIRQREHSVKSLSTSCTKTTSSSSVKHGVPKDDETLEIWKELGRCLDLSDVVKHGVPKDDETLEIWKELGRCLDLSDAELHEIDQVRDQLSEKGYHMLKHWKTRKRSCCELPATETSCAKHIKILHEDNQFI